MNKTHLIEDFGKCLKTLFLVCVLAVSSSASAFGITGEICDDATAVPLNDSVRDHGDFGDRFYKLEVPAAGLVTLDVAAPGTAEVAAKLGFFGRGCGTPSQGRFAVVEQTPTGLVLMTDAPNTYVFAVAAQDSQSSLGEYKLTVGYAAAETRPEPGDGGPVMTNALDEEGEDPDEIETEPNLTGGAPDANGDKDSPRQDLSSLIARFDPMSRELCRELTIDDHGDTALCATGIRPGREVTGRIINSWTDDHDLFVFTLRSTRTVVLKTEGAIDTFGGLYDQHGHLLAADDDGEGSGSFRIVKTLSAGLYFIRVEGSHGSQGPYTLSVEARAW